MWYLVFSHLAHDVPYIGVIHWIAGDGSHVPVEDVHQVPFLAVFQDQIKLVHLIIECMSSILIFCLCDVTIVRINGRDAG